MKLTDEAINDLINVNQPGIGYSASVTGTAFAPLSRFSLLQTGIGSTTLASVPIELQRIVEAGADGLPLLLDHLTDNRKSRCTIDLPFSTSVANHTDIDEANRDHLSGHRPVMADWDEGPNYCIRVGDLCYVALGQIVNRRYAAVYYRPSLLTIINSPVISASIAATVRKLWVGATPTTHLASLARDLNETEYSGRRTGAALRLLYYYPDAASALLVNELQRPIYSSFDVYNNFNRIESILGSANPNSGLQEYEARLDPLLVAGLFSSLSEAIDQRPVLRRSQDDLRAILSRRASQIKHPISSALQTDLINHLSRFPSDAILDTSLLNLFRELSWRQLDHGEQFDIVIIACAKRLVDDPSHAGEVQSLCRRHSAKESMFREDYNLIIHRQ